MLTDIALNKLHSAPAEVNSRKTQGSIKDLVASIQAIGQLQPILVRPLETPGEYEIIDGHRRFAAMKEIANGHGDETTVHAFVVDGIDRGAATEMSLAANIVREQLHPVDEYEAFAELVRQGLGVKEIAQAFATTQKLVKQRIALGEAIPDVRKAWRDDKINTETFKAFAILPVEKQQEIWDAAKAEGLDGYRIYNFLKTKVIDSEGRIGRWVPRKEYEERGGRFAVDLFGEGGNYADLELAITIARENLVAWKNDKLADGWGNVVCPLLGDELISNSYTFPTPTPVDYEWDSEANKMKALELDGWELRQHQNAHATPLYDRDDMARATLYVDENWHEHPPMLPKHKPEKDEKPAEEPAGIPASLRDELNAVFTDEAALAVMRNQALADALAVNALVESFIGRSWGQPTTIRAEHSKATSAQAIAARAIKDLGFEKLTTSRRMKALMNMSKKDACSLRACLVASFILGTDNNSDLAKLVGPTVQIEHRWNDELKQRYFGALKKPQLIEWLGMFAGIEEPDTAKKSVLVAKCVENCGDWMPDELKPQKKSSVLE